MSTDMESTIPPDTSDKRKRSCVPLEPMKESHAMDPKERVFLEAVERGDRHTVERCLQPPKPVDANCTDMLGRSALQIAVDNENIEIVELLLRDPGIQVGSALLQAIREGGYIMVEMLVNHPSMTREMLASDWARSAQSESSEHSPDISPVMMAAHCNQFEILQLMLSRGAMIEGPHRLQCECQKCQVGKHNDSLRHSLYRINTFRALSSPAWVSLTSDDPILTAFKLSWELDNLAQKESEFKSIYLELSQQCKKYSCDLLDLCRSTDEVVAVLNYEPGHEVEDNETSETQIGLSRLKLALKYEQKQFVAHPNCQQLLASLWFEGLPSWRRQSAPARFLLCAGLITALPLVALYYLIFPRTRMGRVVRSPFMKFMYHSASFGFFLMLILLTSVGKEGKHDRSLQNIRGPPLSALEGLVYIWVLGMVWNECKQVWDEGLRGYARQCWNWLDFIMLSLYLASFALRAVSTWQIGTGRYGPKVMDRGRWPDNDPTLIAEGIFAIAGVFSFARIIYLCQTNPHLGPLQISLGCIVKDIVKFLIIFFLVLTSFACGLNQLFRHYEPETEHCVKKTLSSGESTTLGCEKNSDSFITIGNAYVSLFWALFGVSSPKNTDLALDDFKIIETLGQGLFLVYHVIAIVVLVNMLIAMMTKSFEVIENHADMEWKFARSKLWMGYFDEGSTMPPPFNLIVSIKSLVYTYEALKRGIVLIRKTFSKGNGIKGGSTLGLDEEKPPEMESQGNDQDDILTRSSSYKNLDYQNVMRLLVTRYIHQTKKQLSQDGVNEDDLLEIKQDISSLRFELREDRKREASRTGIQIEKIKRDIIRTLRSNDATKTTEVKIPFSSLLTLDEENTQDTEMETTKAQLESARVPDDRKHRPAFMSDVQDVAHQGKVIPGRRNSMLYGNLNIFLRKDVELLKKSIIDQIRVDFSEIKEQILSEVNPITCTGYSNKPTE